MKRVRALFIIIGLLGAIIGATQPQAQSIEEQRGNITSLMLHRGYRTAGTRNEGGALTVMTFSSDRCKYIRVFPISLLQEETPLLKFIGAKDDRHQFVFINERWDHLQTRKLAIAQIKEAFLQLIRFEPLNAMDTMLYVSWAQGCPNLETADWSMLWDRGGAAFEHPGV